MEHLHLLETAIRLAAKVHRGQVDRFGKPYVLHVMRVMMRGHDLEEQILGALHDVLERSDLTVEDIGKKGFSPRVIKALQHITRDPQETYEQYIDRVVLEDIHQAAGIPRSGTPALHAFALNKALGALMLEKVSLTATYGR